MTLTHKRIGPLMTTTEAAVFMGFENGKSFLRWARAVGFPLVFIEGKSDAGNRWRVSRPEAERWILEHTRTMSDE